MNAQELTKYIAALENRLIEAEKEIEFLKDKVEKHELKISDLEWDVRQR